MTQNRNFTFSNLFSRAGLAAVMLVSAACATAGNDAGEHKMMRGDEHGPHIFKTVSGQNFDDTLASLHAAIDKRGFTTFAVIDHARGAASIDQPLPPTTLVIFGNPKGGTPLMQSARTIGIALPLKALVYQDADEGVVVAVPDVAHLLHEHGVSGQAALAEKIAGALAAIADEAAGIRP